MLFSQAIRRCFSLKLLFEPSLFSTVPLNFQSTHSLPNRCFSCFKLSNGTKIFSNAATLLNHYLLYTALVCALSSSNAATLPSHYLLYTALVCALSSSNTATLPSHYLLYTALVCAPSSSQVLTIFTGQSNPFTLPDSSYSLP